MSATIPIGYKATPYPGPVPGRRAVGGGAVRIVSPSCGDVSETGLTGHNREGRDTLQITGASATNFVAAAGVPPPYPPALTPKASASRSRLGAPEHPAATCAGSMGQVAWYRRTLLDTLMSSEFSTDPHDAVMALLGARPDAASICPSEVARALARARSGPAAEWRAAMPEVHAAVDRLLENHCIHLSWKGAGLVVRAGPYRIHRGPGPGRVEPEDT